MAMINGEVIGIIGMHIELGIWVCIYPNSIYLPEYMFPEVYKQLGFLPRADETVPGDGEQIGAIVGTVVFRRFEGRMYSGRITAVPGNTGPDDVVYHVLYEDGDEEDLALHELLSIVPRVQTIKHRALAKVRAWSEYAEKQSRTSR